ISCARPVKLDVASRRRGPGEQAARHGMSEADDSWDRLIHGLRVGDAQAVREFCDRYGGLLEQLAERRLPTDVRRRVGPEDVVQSVCRTFLRRARAGEFQLGDTPAPWRPPPAIPPPQLP